VRGGGRGEGGRKMIKKEEWKGGKDIGKEAQSEGGREGEKESNNMSLL